MAGRVIRRLRVRRGRGRRRRGWGEDRVIRDRRHRASPLCLGVTEPVVGQLGIPGLLTLTLRRLLLTRPGLAAVGPLLVGAPLLGRRGLLPLPLLGWCHVLLISRLRRDLHPRNLPRRSFINAHGALHDRLVEGARVCHAHGTGQVQVQPTLSAGGIVRTHLGAASRTKHSLISVHE